MHTFKQHYLQEMDRMTFRAESDKITPRVKAQIKDILTSAINLRDNPPQNPDMLKSSVEDVHQALHAAWKSVADKRTELKDDISHVYSQVTQLLKNQSKTDQVQHVADSVIVTLSKYNQLLSD